MLDHLKYGPILSAVLNAITPSRMEDFPSAGMTSPNEEWLFNKQDRIDRISKYFQGDFFCTGKLSRGLESPAYNEVTKGMCWALGSLVTIKRNPVHQKTPES